MFGSLKSLWDTVTTDKFGGKCPIRLGYIFFVITGIAATVISVLKGNPFNMTDFGVGAGSLLASGGLGVGAKSKLGGDDLPVVQSEPEPTKPAEHEGAV